MPLHAISLTLLVLLLPSSLVFLFYPFLLSLVSGLAKSLQENDSKIQNVHRFNQLSDMHIQTEYRKLDLFMWQHCVQQFNANQTFVDKHYGHEGKW